MDAFPIFPILGLVLAMLIHIDATVGPNIFNILDYGAAGDGNTDDTVALIKMWNDTCNAKKGSPTMIIPKGKTFRVHSITFSGPCNSKIINVQLLGAIVAPNSPDEWKQADQSRWLAFSGVIGLNIAGPGLIDGRGENWWYLSCKQNPKQGCIKLAPTVLSFIECEQVTMSSIQVMNSPQTHITVFGSKGVDFGSLTVNAPASSPNTDGIHIQSSTFVSIHGSDIGSGDDCVSIGDHTSNINITDVNCGPGHGVSIGSLGKDGNVVQVDNITVTRVNFKGTTNGARIKTWPYGRGQVRQIVFQNLNFTAVENPIIIDQHYCDVAHSCKETKDAGVHISDVSYYGLVGTSKTNVAVTFNCSKTVACTNIQLDTIQLTSAVPGESVISICSHAYGVAKGLVQPKSCLVR